MNSFIGDAMLVTLGRVMTFLCVRCVNNLQNIDPLVMLASTYIATDFLCENVFRMIDWKFIYCSSAEYVEQRAVHIYML